MEETEKIVWLQGELDRQRGDLDRQREELQQAEEKSHAEMRRADAATAQLLQANTQLLESQKRLSMLQIQCEEAAKDPKVPTPTSSAPTEELNRLRQENKELFPLKMALKKAKEEAAHARRQGELMRPVIRAEVEKELRAETTAVLQEAKRAQKKMLEKEENERGKPESFMAKLERARAELSSKQAQQETLDEQMTVTGLFVDDVDVHERSTPDVEHSDDELDVSTPRSMAIRSRWRHAHVDRRASVYHHEDEHGQEPPSRALENDIITISQWHQEQERAHRERRRLLWGPGAGGQQ